MGFQTKKVKKTKADQWIPSGPVGTESFDTSEGSMSFGPRLRGESKSKKPKARILTKPAGYDWSAQQLAIFEACASTDTANQNLVIEALAGTGKTTTAVAMLKHLQGKILYCAFNKRIAQELEARINEAKVGDNVHAKTLHGLGYGLVQRLQPNTQVDNMRGLGLAKAALSAVGGPISKNYQWMVKNAASICKEVAPYLKVTDGNVVAEIAYGFGHFDRLDPRFLDVVCDAVLDSMRRSLEPTGSIDYSDMLYVPLHRIASRGEYDVVVVDEAQDMNRAQLALAQQVLKENGRLIVVGDRHQAIYGFRGADKGSMDRLAEAFKARKLPLSVTYRCPRSVVSVANAFVPDLESAPGAPDGEVLYKNYDYLRETATAGSFILSRLNGPLLRLCLAFVKEGRPAIVEGKDVGAGLIQIIGKLTFNDPNFGLNRFIDAVRVWCITECKRAEAADDLDRAAQVEDQYQSLVILAEGCDTMLQLRTHIEKMFDDTNGKGNKIILSTVHKAKGLESKSVFILCDTFKGSWDEGVGEEANLKYVAITRSKGSLCFILHPNPPTQGVVNAGNVKRIAASSEVVEG